MIPTDNDSLDVFNAVILPLARPFEAFLDALLGKRDAGPHRVRNHPATNPRLDQHTKGRGEK